ncbi:MAG: hypothetical protein AAF383_01325 [Cyanobacteria bacterium P01_A01_bin.83]
MSSEQTHYPKNHRSKLRIGIILFLGSVLIYLGISFIFLFILDLDNYQPSLDIIVMKVIVGFTPITGLIGLFILGTTTSKIVTSPEGVELHQFGFCAKTTWNNVYKIDSFKSGMVSGYALYLHQPAKDFFKLFPSIPVANSIMIPLYKYRFDEGSPLGQELLKYKPGLF